MSVTRRIAYVVLVIVLFAVGLELIVRTCAFVAGRGFLDNPAVFSSPFFTSTHELQPVIDGDMFTFANGRQVSIHKPPHEVRIVCFGGSTTVNARAGVRYTDIVEDQLRAEGHDIRVLNAATDGFSTAHSVVNFALRCLEVKPDAILVHHNINDLSANSFGEVTPDYGNKYLGEFYLGYRHRTGVLAQIEKVSRVARFIRYSIGSARYSLKSRAWTEWDKGLSLFERNLQTIHGIAQAHGIEVVLATQAARSDLRTDPGFLAYNEAIRRFGQQKGTVVIDLAAAIEDDGSFVDRVHFTRTGVESVADLLLPQFRQIAKRHTAKWDSTGVSPLD